MKKIKTTRRQFLKTAALATGALATGAPFIRHSHAAGKLSIALWDHWVPGANDVQTKLIQDWAKKNKVDMTVDYITSVGEKNSLTATAEARAGTGHDIFMLPQWYPTILRKRLEPIDDVVKDLVKVNGPFSNVAEYACKHDGSWRAIPAPTGSHSYPMVSRLDLFKQHCGVDLTKVFPTDVKKRDKKLVDAWNYDNFLVYAEKLHKAGFPFGNPIGQTSDTNSWLGPLFTSFGSVLVDAKGNITVNSDATRQVLEYMKRLVQFMPPEIYAWDDAGNNRWIISGRGSCIQNPPSAWTVAKRDQPAVAAQLWHHDTPRGPKGHFRGDLLYNLALFNFSQNKPAAKDLMRHMSQREQVFTLITASQGYDLPQVAKFLTHDSWKTVGPPVGGQFNYPVRGDETRMVGGWPAPPAIAGQIYVQSTFGNLVSRYTTGQSSMNDAIKWAENELEGFLREA
jgi:ABC-type glycerol-3-phosphate transport system substrate-binding protein